MLARSYSHAAGVKTNRHSTVLHTNLEVFDELLHPRVSAFVQRHLGGVRTSRHSTVLHTNLEVFDEFPPVLARSYSIILVVLESVDIQLVYIQTLRYLMSSSIPVLARVSVILVVLEPVDIQLFYIHTLRYLMSSSIPVLVRSYSYIPQRHFGVGGRRDYVQTLRYLMSSSIPVLARSYSVILVVSEADDTTYKPRGT